MRIVHTLPFAILSCVAATSAQPQLGVASTNAPCAAGPALVGDAPDTVASVPDADGFVSLFDGKTLKGWWENCNTNHSSQDRTDGGLWIADSTHGALYSQQAPSRAGSVLMTNKSYEHYELVFDFWPSWGNDAGVFNRVVPTGNQAGRTFQTGLDYKQGSSIAGAYGEGGYGSPAGFNHDPYLFTTTHGVITVSSWTAFTGARNPASFGCPAGGCGVSDWHAVWDTAGWNQIRIKFYGGLSQGSTVKMSAWFRRIADPPAPPPDNWVPVYADSQTVPAPANPIGLQIHGGADYWNLNGRGTWYRNIRIRELDSLGNPVAPTSLRSSPGGGASAARVRVVAGALEGTFDAAHEVIVRDARGALLSRHRGGPGAARYAPGGRGLLTVEIREEGRPARFARMTVL